MKEKGNKEEMLPISIELKKCDLCGSVFLGQGFKVFDENFNIQRGVVGCGCHLKKKNNAN